jgi:hypothetical protein
VRFSYSFVAAAIAVLGLALPQRAAAADALTGKMDIFNYAIGTWTCTANVPAMESRPAQTVRVTATFEAVPGNAVHEHVAGPDYSGDDYIGYSNEGSIYWIASADNSGEHGAATSSDGKIFAGTRSLGPISMTGTTAFTKVSETDFKIRQVISGQGHQFTLDSECRR